VKLVWWLAAVKMGFLACEALEPSGSIGSEEGKRLSGGGGSQRLPAGPTADAGFIERLAAGWSPHGRIAGPVVVGVSGGADSTALLHGLLHGVLPRLGRDPASTLIVAHARHDIRDEAADDEAFVADLAAAAGLRFTSRRLAVRREAAASGEGLEGAARRLRYEFFSDLALSSGARLVAVAHTLDDQVETVLHRLLRGTAAAGLAGMPSARQLVEGVALVRPMLALTARQARDYLREVGQAWREDATNRDTRQTRNFLRHEILPRLHRGPFPAAREAVGRLSGELADAASVLADATDLLLDAHAQFAAEGSVRLDARPLVGRHPRLLSELFAAIWRRADWPRRDMTAGHYQRLVELLGQSAGEGPAAVSLPGGIEARREQPGVLRLGRVQASEGAVVPPEIQSGSIDSER